jgi:hypothetical protein
MTAPKTGGEQYVGCGPFMPMSQIANAPEKAFGQ